mmetsp:Transcript_18395/g.61568  ORF Transcript_18395/g.61568 Transcript_18395/m.61568 type:complete len:232 (+) Transcript_18395:132-827(+)
MLGLPLRREPAAGGHLAGRVPRPRGGPRRRPRPGPGRLQRAPPGPRRALAMGARQAARRAELDGPLPPGPGGAGLVRRPRGSLPGLLPAGHPAPRRGREPGARERGGWGGRGPARAEPGGGGARVGPRPWRHRAAQVHGPRAHARQPPRSGPDPPARGPRGHRRSRRDRRALRGARAGPARVGPRGSLQERHRPPADPALGRGRLGPSGTRGAAPAGLPGAHLPRRGRRGR